MRSVGEGHLTSRYEPHCKTLLRSWFLKLKVKRCTQSSDLASGETAASERLENEIRGHEEVVDGWDSRISKLADPFDEHGNTDQIPSPSSCCHHKARQIRRVCAEMRVESLPCIEAEVTEQENRPAHVLFLVSFCWFPMPIQFVSSSPQRFQSAGYGGSTCMDVSVGGGRSTSCNPRFFHRCHSKFGHHRLSDSPTITTKTRGNLVSHSLFNITLYQL